MVWLYALIIILVRNLFYPIQQKNRTFLNQKLGINIIYKLDVLFRFHYDKRIIIQNKYFKIVVVYHSDLDILFLNMNILI